jgi:gliding motility-associated-like protein
MIRFLKTQAILATFIFGLSLYTYCQSACTTLGQTPSTAFPVCGTTTFQQTTVPLCSTNPLFVPGCSGNGNANYENKNPFFYKFTCYVSGSLGFLITPISQNEDYDWQLWDITGHNPDDIFTDNTLIVTGNWAGSYGATGASATGVNFIQCASIPGDNAPTFAAMPNLIQNHQYLLMISHFTDGQSGYSLSFGGGTGVITDPTQPHMATAKADCDGRTITLRLNKKARCNSLTASGSEFSISPAATTVVSAITGSCTIGFDFDTLTITLAAPLPNGNYQLVINNGTDGNTLKDYCDNTIPVNESIPFQYFAPQPIFADSIGKPGCTPDSIKVYFPKRIACSSIAADGSDFSVSGPTPVTVSSANGNCINGKTDYVVVHFTSPIFTKGTYQLTLKAGSDGTILIDECGQQTPTQTLPFQTADTVSAAFQYQTLFGCQRDTFLFSHDGAHDVNSWSWTFNSGGPIRTQNVTGVFPATSSDTIRLIVSNGVCRDTASTILTLSNEVKAAFTMPDVICPEDKLEVKNTSTGQIDIWKWNYDVIGTSNLKDPPPFQMPNNNREAYYTIKLVAYNNALGCRDSTKRTLTVLDNCLILVPTAFTPNNDGLNDYFWPHNALKADNLKFMVFNRWGQKVFESKTWRDKWDGRINGAMQNTGVFVWMLSYTNRDTKKEVFQKGTVTLIR